MRRYLLAAAATLALGTAGWATASVAQNGPRANGQTTLTTGTTVTNGTTTVARKVTICHRTRSKKKPWRQITVSQNAAPAHMRHGDRPPPCPTTPAPRR